MPRAWFIVPCFALAACTSSAREFGASTSGSATTGTAGASSAVSSGGGGEMASSVGVGASGTSTGGSGGGGIVGTGGSSPCGQCNPGLLCDANLGCVDCLTNDDCSAQKPHCLLGQCVVCETNADCNGMACAPKNHTCVDFCPPCGDPTAPLCNPSGECVGCASDLECGNSLHCSPTFGQCVKCLTDNHCVQDKAVCDQTSGACVECLFTQDCKAALTCVDKSCR